MGRKIRPGSLVMLKKKGATAGMSERLQRWAHFYGQGPFLVHAMSDDQHVTLKDRNEKIIHWGDTADPSLHIAYVKPL